jgi:hypothetical protein
MLEGLRQLRGQKRVYGWRVAAAETRPVNSGNEVRPMRVWSALPSGSSR